jgi:hypothetical protein
MTPGGDDFLTGVLLGETVARLSNKIPTGPVVDKKEIPQRISTTTFAGRSLITLALNGSFPAYLLAILDGYRSPIGADRQQVFLETLRHGATSGKDALAGFLWYMDIAVS